MWPTQQVLLGVQADGDDVALERDGGVELEQSQVVLKWNRLKLANSWWDISSLILTYFWMDNLSPEFDFFLCELFPVIVNIVLA